jgi:hypothetical protein
MQLKARDGTQDSEHERRLRFVNGIIRLPDNHSLYRDTTSQLLFVKPYPLEVEDRSKYKEMAQQYPSMVTYYPTYVQQRRDW